MKTKITISAVLISLVAVAVFFSCDNPVSLGSRLDLEGPVVTIISPAQRQSVPVEFEIEGTVSDNTSVDIMEVKAIKARDNQELSRRWRYNSGSWEISGDYGATWSPYAEASWTGTDKSLSWKFTVNMLINGRAEEGEYTFNFQAWDKGGFTDDNSFKSLAVIVDLDPPKVDITNPYLYRSKDAYEIDPFKKLHDIPDLSDEWKDPAYLGKFITQEFSFKWQIEDVNDVWSIDLRFYKHDAVIDNDPGTPLPEDYIYKYFRNTPPPPKEINPNDYVKLNGDVNVPDLDSPAGTYEGGGVLKNPVSEKTTIKVVAVCYDAAGNPNQEKTLGYFICWPRANTPWIVFTEGIKPPDEFYGRHAAYDKDDPDADEVGEYIEDEIFMVYPGRSVKATAFQAHGVKEVKYSLYKCDTSGNILHPDTPAYPFTVEKENVIVKNTSYNGVYSTIFPWELEVPPFTGYYVFTAEAYSSQDKPSERYVMLFRVHDITFPDFPEPVKPSASEPLFKAIGESVGKDKFTISGVVSDATQVKSLCLVWINPLSEGYKAQSQLAYFRDQNYPGWGMILPYSPGSPPIDEGLKDSTFKNKLWKLVLTQVEPDYVTNRRRYEYSLDINLNTLNIGMDKNALSSQTFLLRAENPDGKCTIITYAPQGDTRAPEISITRAIIDEGKPTAITCEAGQNTQINKFDDGFEHTIKIIGAWKEDSVEFLPINDYFRSNFKITVNNVELGYPNLTGTAEGEWTYTVTVKPNTPISSGQILASQIKDALVINTNVKDIGGNTAQHLSSWLIKSDNLKLMGIYGESPDGTYRAGDTVRIFLEFSKPVMLKPGVTNPVLTLNTGGMATYDPPTVAGTQNSRQYFNYTVTAGQNTPANAYLNVTGLQGVTTTFTGSDYRFSWYKGAGEDNYEEVRITTAAGHTEDNLYTGTNYYVRTLPTSATDPSSLIYGTRITIDTAAPTVEKITTNMPNYYKAGDEIYITATFNESVHITGVPRLTLNFPTGGTQQTSTTAADVTVNGKEITFKYTVPAATTPTSSHGSAVVISTYTGTITDLAGNQLDSDAVSNNTKLSTANKTLTGVYVENRAPPAPVVRILSAGNVTANDTNALRNTVNGTSRPGVSGAAVVDLSTLYNNNIWLAIQGRQSDTGGYAAQYDSIEYSVVATGAASYVKAPNTNNTPFELTQSGAYSVVARQIDAAGNTSPASAAITFTRDPGNLVSRISSSTANGTYSHNAPNTIALTVYFRKNVSIGAGTITLNATRSGSNISLTVPATSNTASVMVNYTVQNGDSTGGAKLSVTGLSIPTATDGTSTSAGVTIPSGLITNPGLDSTKEFYVETGDLTNTNPTFTNAAPGAVTTPESNANYHGIRSDDGSYWTTLQIQFNHAVNKGSGNITIKQTAGSGTATGYRLPAVLTEAQYNRFKNVPDIDKYYTKGTNGYINGTGSDTSTKYVLNYNYNPRSDVTTNNAGFTGDTFIPNTFFDAFRTAEAIIINVNAQAVTLSGDNRTLYVRLSGSNAPQVPGASYEVTYPAGLVTDSIGNNSTAGNYTVALGGVAKPFIRIKRAQDTIEAQTGSASVPRLKANQPFLSYARIDCRTPNSTITYTGAEGRTNLGGNNPGVGTSNNNWAPGTTTIPNNTNNTNNNNTTMLPTRPANATGTSYTNSGQITLGQNADSSTVTIENVQGYQWWARARAGVGATYSNETEEVAYRTVISYSLRNGNAAITAASASFSVLANGDQVWLRGGDALSSSSVPGFPFTWEDNWGSLAGKRAGIRLMTLVAVSGNTLNNSLWRFVTWDMNTTGYVDFIRGRDATIASNENGTNNEDVGEYTASSAAVAWQYGPKRWTYQRDGWTAAKESYPIYAGKHRWCDAGYNHNFAGATRGVINFSGTFSARPDMTVDHPNANQP